MDENEKHRYRVGLFARMGRTFIVCVLVGIVFSGEREELGRCEKGWDLMD